MSNVEGSSAPRRRKKGGASPGEGEGQGKVGKRHVSQLVAVGKPDPRPSFAGPDLSPPCCHLDAGGRCTSGFTPFSPRSAESALVAGEASPARLPSVATAAARAVSARRPERAVSGSAGRGPGAGDSGRDGEAEAGVPAASPRGRCGRLAHAGPRRQGASAPALRVFREPSCFVAGRRRGSFLLRRW